MTDTLTLRLYGVTVAVTCADPEVRTRVAGDFSYFRVDGSEATGAAAPNCDVIAHRQAPRYDNLPPLIANIYSPRNVSYTGGDVTYIDYFGRALSVYHRGARRIEVFCDHPHLLHEILYLSILSHVAERLERQGLHRVHALGVEFNGQSALFLMPPGGGKTTLALEFLKRKDIYKLVSEDSPLIDSAGRILPFPLRLGMVAEAGAPPPPFPAEHVTYVERMEFGPEYLIAMEAFEGAVATAASTPRFLCIGRRTLAADCTIHPAGRWRGFRALVDGMIVGVGLYQGVEFLLRTSVLDLLRLASVIWSRLLRALTLLRRCEVVVINLGREPARNADVIMAFLAARGFGRATGNDAKKPE